MPWNYHWHYYKGAVPWYQDLADETEYLAIVTGTGWTWRIEYYIHRANRTIRGWTQINHSGYPLGTAYFNPKAIPAGTPWTVQTSPWTRTAIDQLYGPVSDAPIP